jgi:hypothetical protein
VAEDLADVFSASMQGLQAFRMMVLTKSSSAAAPCQDLSAGCLQALKARSTRSQTRHCRHRPQDPQNRLLVDPPTDALPGLGRQFRSPVRST